MVNAVTLFRLTHSANKSHTSLITHLPEDIKVYKESKQRSVGLQKQRS